MIIQWTGDRRKAGFSKVLFAYSLAGASDVSITVILCMAKSIVFTFTLANIQDTSILFTFSLRCLNSFTFSMVEAFRCLNLIYILFGRGFRSLYVRGFRVIHYLLKWFQMSQSHLHSLWVRLSDVSILFTFSLAGVLDL